MFVCTSGAFLTLSLCSGPCSGATCWDCRGPWSKRAQGRNEQDRTHKGSHSLRKGMTKHISRGLADWSPIGKILFFSTSFIQKNKRLKHQNTLTKLQPFCFCHVVPLLPMSLTKYKLLFSKWKPFIFPSHCDKGMCSCRFWPCQNAAKPQQPCQSMSFSSQQWFFKK
jgi:hypothetical protein